MPEINPKWDDILNMYSDEARLWGCVLICDPKVSWFDTTHFTMHCTLYNPKLGHVSLETDENLGPLWETPHPHVWQDCWSAMEVAPNAMPWSDPANWRLSRGTGSVYGDGTYEHKYSNYTVVISERLTMKRLLKCFLEKDMVESPTVYFSFSWWEWFDYLLPIGWTILNEDYLEAAKDKLLPQREWFTTRKKEKT